MKKQGDLIMKKIICTLALLSALSVSAFAQTMLDLRQYFSYFPIRINEKISDNDYVWTSDERSYERFAIISGEDILIDTPLEFALLSYYSQPVINMRPTQADAILPRNNPRLADQKLGAAVFQEIQIFRFLNDTAAVNRHEAVLQFIIGRGNATRAEIETFYRNNIRALISQVVDEEFNKVSFSFENAAKTRGYNSVLTRNLQTGYYEINCTGFFGTNTMQTKTFSGSTLDTLITQMRNNTADFDQACINAVRAQAALIPAVVYADWKQRGIANGVDGLELIIETITNFYLSPNNNTYNILRGVYARLFIMSTAERDEFASIVNGAFVTVLSYLNSGISGKVVNENRSEMASALTSDSRYRIFSTSYRSVR